MARFSTLFSSSSGNATYIGSPTSGILIDAGMNAKQIELALSRLCVDVNTIKAIFVTHEHSDHIGALRVLAGRYGINVYASKGTLTGLEAMNCLTGKFNADIIEKGGVCVADMHITPFHTSHDSRESLGFIVCLPDGRKIAVATDTGIVTSEILSSLLGCDLVLLESNHDKEMLEYGPYPYILKKRIRSELGHLSNDVCANTLCELVNKGTTRVVLGHLSKENNRPELAYSSAKTALEAIGAVENRDYLLQVAPPSVQKKLMIF